MRKTPLDSHDYNRIVNLEKLRRTFKRTGLRLQQAGELLFYNVFPEPAYPIPGHKGLVGVLMIEPLTRSEGRLMKAMVHPSRAGKMLKRIIDKHLKEERRS